MATVNSQSAVVDVGEFLDVHGVRAFHVTTIALCALAMITDGYALYVLAYVILPLAKHFGVSGAAMTPVVVSQFLGVAIGSYTLSPLADRLGRKTVMVSCLALLCLSTLLLPFMETMFRLGVLRFLSGVFVSGVVPNAIALASELVPKHVRATTVGFLYVGFSAGPTLAAVAAAALLPTLGWPALFYLGGAIPLLLVPILGWYMPESLRFLVVRRPQDPRIRTLLARTAPNFEVPEGARYVITGERQKAISATVLFTDGHAGRTILLWVVFFAVGLNLALLGAWLPTFMVAGGLPMSRALVLAAIYGVGAICGALLWSVLADSLRSPAAMLTISLIIATGSLVALPSSDLTGWQGILDMLVAGGCLVGAISLLSGLAATLYPTSIRAMGIGWGIGAGRVANVVGPALGGMMLGAHWQLGSLSRALDAVTLVGVGGSALTWAIQRKRLESHQ
ncbi:MAG: MFS transporter [Steroidobacteraceae bacterium]